MPKPGRRSAADIKDTKIAEIRRPSPPSWMSKSERAEWKAIVAQKPPEWATRDRYPLLEAYCTHAILRREAAKRLDELMDGDVSEIRQWATVHDGQSKQINSLGIRLEIAQSTSYEANRRNQAGKKAPPWQR